MNIIQPYCTAVMEITNEYFPLKSRNAKMNNEPKNMRPKATIVPDKRSKTCFEYVFSAAQNTVASSINRCPTESLKSGDMKR